MVSQAKIVNQIVKVKQMKTRVLASVESHVIARRRSKTDADEEDWRIGMALKISVRPAHVIYVTTSSINQNISNNSFVNL